MEPLLSVIIPAYNEAERIGPSLDSILSFLSSQPYKSEVVVVDDGSSDGTGTVVASHSDQYQKAGIGLRVLTNVPNAGKGYSVKRGVKEARGEIVLFTDADLSSPITEAPKLIDPIRHGSTDVVIGSRGLDRSLIGVHQPGLRELRGRVSNLLIRMMTGLPFKDTQCGFKAFRRKEALPAFLQQRIKGFGFDPELLFILAKHGLRSIEVPVVWNHCEGSKVGYFLDSLKCLTDLFVIRLNNIAGRYPTPGESDLAIGSASAMPARAAANAAKQGGGAITTDDPVKR
ncbi:MAG TPA: dolichyl-phosphate beta-glucosyltransferase [Blastocatellia bacterium]|nr:dolichyl-phosphate beta-glucosyltransferase [Blastocatellia bacterium]